MEFLRNHDKNRFELHTEGHTAYIEYTLNDNNTISLPHTIVPEELGGKGIGKVLAQKTFEHIKAAGYTFIPICSFLASYVEKNPEWKAYVAV
ncbi:MAG TPA: GNAT family N-acetyltransferase [Flavobacterium sp.]|nr:GNAT family N-acetyltransferase [Flavobacterium sp.]